MLRQSSILYLLSSTHCYTPLCPHGGKSDMISRRSVLKGAVAAAALSAIRPVAAEKNMKVVVVGAGAFGGWTAWQLLRKGAQVTLIDAYGPGNSRASSGGETRV